MSHAAWHVAISGAVARLQGRYDEAVSIGRDAVAMTQQAPHSWAAAVAGAELGTTLLEMGDADEAIAVLARTRIVAASQSGAEASLLRCLAPLAEATGSAVILADAAALLGRIRAPAGSAFITGDGCYLAVARAWLASGEPQKAGRAAPAAGRRLGPGRAAGSSVAIDARPLARRRRAATGTRRGAGQAARPPRIASDAATVKTPAQRGAS
jgi:hypothetical protein